MKAAKRKENRNVIMLYHRTYRHKEILTNGFKDGIGSYMTNRIWEGVWFSDRPLDSNEGAYGDRYLVIKMPEKVAKPYEWVEEGKQYREFLIPSKVANRYPVKVIDE